MGRGLLPYEILEIVERELQTRKFGNEFATTYLEAILSFVTDHIVHRLAKVRKGRGMYDALERGTEWDADTDLSLGGSGELL